MPLRHLALGLLAAGALAPAAGKLAGPAPGAAGSSGKSIGMRLVDAPVDARANSRAWCYIIDHLAPGSVIHRRVEVSNATDSPRTLSIYAAAGAIRGSKFAFAPGRTPNDLSTWTTTDRPEVAMAPHARSMVTATIAVPRDAAPGERYAVIWAEAATPPPRSGGVAEVNRVGVRIYLSVGQGNPPASSFTIDSLTAQRSENGRQIVLAQVRNTGGRALDLVGDLRLSHGPANLSAGPFKVSTGTTLAPGDSGPVMAVLNEQVPDGPWRARVRLQSGLTKAGAEATIRFPASAGMARAVNAEQDTSHLPIVVLVGGGVVLCGLATATGLLVLRKRRSRRELSAAGSDL
ncbi:peptidase [Sphaerisporangium sp. NPDC049003]|uniref:peptidase n=1 Tax=Sphaerisporangium sp. NPDC049003 TaxID=3364517 RepID=UPI0037132C0F